MTNKKSRGGNLGKVKKLKKPLWTSFLLLRPLLHSDMTPVQSVRSQSALQRSGGMVVVVDRVVGSGPPTTP